MECVYYDRQSLWITDTDHTSYHYPQPRYIELATFSSSSAALLTCFSSSSFSFICIHVRTHSVTVPCLWSLEHCQEYVYPLQKLLCEFHPKM